MTRITIERGVRTPMPDGVELAADVHRIDDAPRPVLLQRTPYGRGDALAAYVWGLLAPLPAVEAGFTVVIQDVRGRGDSAGVFEPFRTEAEDGAATIAWLREQPWCDGRVGMYGMSYVGATQLLAAGTAPAGLFAIAPALTAADYFDGWVYEGGILSLGFSLFWSLTDLVPPDLERRGLDRAELDRLRAGLRTMLEDPAAAFRAVPPVIEELAPWFAQWRAHPRRDAYWDAVSPRAGRSATAVPALHLGGWSDIFLAGTLENYRALAAGAATAYARENQRLVIGPWAHGNLSDTVGDHHLGMGAALAALEPERLLLDFFQAALEGREVPGPPVRVFVLGADRWSDEQSWPPGDVVATAYGLRAGGVLSPGASDDGASDYRHDPHDPSPTRGGRTFLPGLLTSLEAGMRDQSALLARADGAVFATAPLDRPLLLIGEVSLSLSMRTEGSDIDVVATLLDIHPDGTALNLTEGSRRASSTDAVVTPGEPIRVEVGLSGVAAELAPGHRLGLRIASASFPRLEVGDNGVGGPAALTVEHRHSTLTLPVRPS